MKKMICALLVLLAAAVQAQPPAHSVNAIMGDISYLEKFGRLPDENTAEVLRLQTHLNYVEQMLRNKDISHLNQEQKANREKVLVLLHEYWSNGVFPKNYDYEGRRPCFIDRHGNICAVGYLIEKTVGREVAEAINEEHQYDFLLDMNEPAIEQWAGEYGLSLEECAMIQPSYGWTPSNDTRYMPVKKGYGISSGVLGGVSVAINLVNLSNRYGGQSRTFSYAGLLTGTTQIVLGLTNIKKDQTENNMMGPTRTISYKAQNQLSYINITAGTTTVITSALNLLINKQIRDKRTAVNLYSYPALNNKMVAGISFSRTL